jgi:hypothetical protein
VCVLGRGSKGSAEGFRGEERGASGDKNKKLSEYALREEENNKRCAHVRWWVAPPVCLCVAHLDALARRGLLHLDPGEHGARRALETRPARDGREWVERRV